MDLSGHQGEIPIPMTTTYIPSAHTTHTHGHTILHHTTSNNNNNNSSSIAPPTPSSANNNNGPSNLAAEDHSSPRRDATAPASAPLTISKRSTVTVKYKECLKNHAASIGGNATDGCGEFMPSGPDGTIEALKCSACGCHRNFHRKEVEGDPYASSCHCKGAPYMYSPAGRSTISVRPAMPSLTHHPHHQMVMPLNAMQTSESDEMEGVGGTPGIMMGSNPAMGPLSGLAGPMTMSGMVGSVRSSSGKKRFRTKFTADQKEKMLNFAEKVGWRLQRLEDGLVQQFCQEIGVKRRVLKVWMHNNKHSLAKKVGGSDDPQHQQQHQQQQQQQSPQQPPQLQLE